MLTDHIITEHPTRKQILYLIHRYWSRYETVSIKGSPDINHFIFKTIVRKNRIRKLHFYTNAKSIEGGDIEIQIRSMSDPPLSDFNFKNIMALVWIFGQTRTWKIKKSRTKSEGFLPRLKSFGILVTENRKIGNLSNLILYFQLKHSLEKWIQDYWIKQNFWISYLITV